MKIILTLVLSALLGAAPAFAQSSKKEEAPKLSPAEKEVQRGARLKTAEEGLEKLYKLQPEARQVIEKAVGYAVFDITSIYAILFVGQKGTGVLYDNATKKPVYMTSLRAGTGPGIGKQRVYQVFAFKSKEAMSQFTLAGGLGGDVTATASAGTSGLVRSFNPTVDIFQVPESGMALQASWGGTVYSVDEQLK